jgi:hypothetical protein
LADSLGIRPRQLLIFVERHVPIGGIVVRTGFKIARRLAIEVAIGEIEGSN